MRSTSTTSRRIGSVVVAAAAVWMVLLGLGALVGDDDAADVAATGAPAAAQCLAPGVDVWTPAGSLTDVVTYADVVAAVTVTGERQGSKTINGDPPEGTISRHLTVSVDEVLWVRPTFGDPAPDSFEFLTAPYWMKNGEVRADQWGPTTFAVGGRYVVAAARGVIAGGNDWNLYATTASWDLVADRLVSTCTEGVAGALNGASTAEVTDRLETTALPPGVTDEIMALPLRPRLDAVLALNSVN